MKVELLGVCSLIMLIILLLSISVVVRADTLNPCEYANLTGLGMQSLNTGQDENFERIKQENNKQLVLECQKLKIKELRQAQVDTY